MSRINAVETAQTSGRKRPFVSVVSPFFNESALIRAAAERMIGRLNEGFEDWELILVDDGSTDDSLARLRDLLADGGETRVTVLSYQPNQGRGRALKTGIDAARGDIVVTTEADLSWGLDIVERLYDALTEHPHWDFVVASPQLRGGGYVGIPRSRQWLSRWGNRAIALFFVSGVAMHTGMTRAYRREVIQPLHTISYDKEFHLEVLLKLRTLEFRAGQIPAVLSWEARRVASRRGRPKANLFTRRMMRTLSTHLLFLAIAEPMRYFGVLTGATLLVAVAFGLAALWNLTTGGVAVFFALIAVILGLFGVLFLGFSVVFTQLRELAAATWRDSHGGAGRRLPVTSWRAGGGAA